jgi:hypothetical protein
MKNFTKEGLITELIQIREQGWIQTKRKNNDGGVGNTLEDLLGIEENNLPIANAVEWELKAQKRGTSLVTLFHLEPSPKAYKFVPSILLPNYGWKHKEAGLKYPDNEMSFRQTINTKIFSDRGFSVQVDRETQKVQIIFDVNKVNLNKHQNWLNFVNQRIGLNNLNPQPYWGFDDLFHKAGTKLHNCFFIYASAKKINGELYFLYQDIYMLKKLDLDKFISTIETGDIYIDFDARTGHNHGTKFRIKKNAFTELYAQVNQF